MEKQRFVVTGMSCVDRFKKLQINFFLNYISFVLFNGLVNWIYTIFRRENISGQCEWDSACHGI